MSDSLPVLSAAGETVLTFLENVGQRSEAEFYLRLFRKLPRQSFALVLVREPALATAPGSLVEQLSFLSDLGLCASLVVGAWSEESSGQSALDLAGHLSRHGLSHALLSLDTPGLESALTAALDQQRVPIIHAQGANCFERVGELAHALKTRKLVILRQRGGLGPHGGQRLDLGNGYSLPTHAGGISVVNLRADYDALHNHGILDSEDEELLACIQSVLESARLPSTTLSVTSPLALLTELFTVKGAGTLVKLGSPIRRYQGYAELNRKSLALLLQSSFQRKLSPSFFGTEPLGIYLEENYRGAAIVQPGFSGAFLTKFAVDPLAQGEGIGQDLWRAMLRDTPKLYWRSRLKNPILGWYKSICDGFIDQEPWAVCWRGYAPSELPELIHDALSRPIDFLD